MLFWLAGCQPSKMKIAEDSQCKEEHAHSHEHGHHHGKEGHEHNAHHGGCLNAIVTCENGHAEVKITEDIIQCWFVGGGSDTGKATPIGDKSITISITTAGSTLINTLVLQAKPLVLAEETIGHCSYFEGKAPWLKGITTFTATGTVQSFRGKTVPLVIEFPKGYDPD